MGIFNKLKDAYNSLSGNSKGGSSEYDIGSLDFSEIDDAALTEEQTLLTDINPEMRDWVINRAKENNGNQSSDASVQPKVVAIQLATDNPTATQILALLGMIRYAMESSAKDDKKKFTMNITVSNRNGSPLLVGLGDTSIPSIPMVEKYEIGS